jgi:hypothetical protein
MVCDVVSEILYGPNNLTDFTTDLGVLMNGSSKTGHACQCQRVETWWTWLDEEAPRQHACDIWFD